MTAAGTTIHVVLVIGDADDQDIQVWRRVRPGPCTINKDSQWNEPPKRKQDIKPHYNGRLGFDQVVILSFLLSISKSCRNFRFLRFL